MQTTLHFRGTPLDSQRIVAVAGAIVVNAMVAMLLIAPLAAPQVVTRDTEDPPFFPTFEPRPVPPPPADPVPVVQTPSQTDATAHHEPKAHVEQTSTPLNTTEPGDTHVEQTVHSELPPGDHGDAETGGGDVGPTLTGAHLEYASAPPPPYPREAMLDGTTGTVILQVRVGVDGKPLDVTISRSSGSRVLDAAARRQVLARWTFRPAMRNGQAIEAIGLVPVEFRLD